MKSIFNLRSLLVQMITAFIAIVILTSATVGVPAIWIVQNQLDRQAWAQVEQGQRMTIALFASHYNEILNLATLTAQRPTLYGLLDQNEITELTEYLITLQSGAGLDRIVVCDTENQLIATTDTNLTEAFCNQKKTENYRQDRTIPQVCLTASQDIEGTMGSLGKVLVCSSIDDGFETQLSEQTGLEHILWIDEIPVSTSLSGKASSLRSIQFQPITLPTYP